MGLSLSPLSVGIGRAIGNSSNPTAAYAVGGINPTYIYDPINDFYFANGEVQTHDAIAPHSLSTLATQVDSDGVLKWGAHNLLSYSEQFDNAAWSSSGIIVSPDTSIAPDGSFSADKIEVGGGLDYIQRPNLGLPTGIKAGLAVFAKADTHDLFRMGHQSSGSSAAWFRLSGAGVVEAVNGGTGLIQPLANGWYLCVFLVSSTNASGALDYFIAMSNTAGSTADTVGQSIYVWGAHFYRSDLGGMVNNPATGNSYVPTTTSAVYKLRQHHHVYNGTAWVDQGDLVEREARTNLETQSVSLSLHDSNVASGGAVTLSQSDPFGGTDAAKLENASGSSPFSFGVLSSVAETKTLSVWLKKNTLVSGTARIQIGSGSTGQGISADIDLTNGTIGAATSQGGSYTAVSSTIEDFGDGWYRASVTAVTPATTHVGYVQISLADVGDSLYFYGPQFEAGATPSSYIPTAGSTVTRAADSALATPAALAPYDATALSLVMKGTMTYADLNSNPQFNFLGWSAGSTDYILIEILTAASRQGQISFEQRQVASGLDNAQSLNSAYSPGVNVSFNFAGRHTSSDINGALDGTALTANTTPTALPDLSATDMGIAGLDYMGTVSLVLGFAGTGLTDAQLEEATS